MSETRKEKFKNGELDLKGENNPMYGKHPSEKTLKLMREIMSEKRKGENNPNSTLKEQDVIEIRIDLDEGILTQKEIAEKFGVSLMTISQIKNRKLWRHI